MCSSSSVTSAAAPSIQQLIQKSTKPTQQQALKDSQKSADSSSAQDALNTSGDRGTKVNINS